MNPETNHLVDMSILQDERIKQLLESGGYEQVPEELAADAREELAGRPDCYVPKKSTSKLSRWARRRREERRRLLNKKIRRAPGCK